CCGRCLRPGVRRVRDARPSHGGMDDGEHARSRRGPLDARRAGGAQARTVRGAPLQGPADGFRAMSGRDGPSGPLLVDQLRFMAAQMPDAVGYRDLSSGSEITFSEWDTDSNRLARWLTDHGVAKGDRVALYVDSDQALRWITAYAAVHKAGAVAVPVNTRLERD